MAVFVPIILLKVADFFFKCQSFQAKAEGWTNKYLEMKAEYAFNFRCKF